MNRISAIALTTFRESIRSKILYTILFFAVVLVGISSLFGSMTIGDQVKVIKDFGLFCVSIFTVAYAVISGAVLLSKELSRKTIYNILSKPVSRGEFLCGKYLGLLSMTWLMILLMGTALALYCLLFENRFDNILFYAYYFIGLQLMIVCALTIFFSSLVVTPILSGGFSFAIFLAGRSSEYLLYFANNAKISKEVGLIIKTIYHLLPHFNMLDTNNQAVYGIMVPPQMFTWSGLYAVAYSAVLLILATIIFRKREFH